MPRIQKMKGELKSTHLVFFDNLMLSIDNLMFSFDNLMLSIGNLMLSIGNLMLILIPHALLQKSSDFQDFFCDCFQSVPILLSAASQSAIILRFHGFYFIHILAFSI